jgi:hypothetical protein
MKYFSKVRENSSKFAQKLYQWHISLIVNQPLLVILIATSFSLITCFLALWFCPFPEFNHPYTVI